MDYGDGLSWQKCGAPCQELGMCAQSWFGQHHWKVRFDIGNALYMALWNNVLHGMQTEQKIVIFYIYSRRKTTKWIDLKEAQTGPPAIQKTFILSNHGHTAPSEPSMVRFCSPLKSTYHFRVLAIPPKDLCVVPFNTTTTRFTNSFPVLAHTFFLHNSNTSFSWKWLSRSLRRCCRISLFRKKPAISGPSSPPSRSKYTTYLKTSGNTIHCQAMHN